MGQVQPALLGLDIAPVTALPRRRRALTFNDASVWCTHQLPWIARRIGADRRGDLVLFMQAAKLVEEVGELHAQLLGRAQAQRPDKAGVFDQAALEDEIADVVLSTLMIASATGVDVGAAVRRKMAVVDERVGQSGAGR